MPEIKYKRVLLKISGEVLSGGKGFGLYPEVFNRMSSEIKSIKDLGVEIGVVVGGGNIFRGSNNQFSLIDRASADYMGMIATIVNAIALQNYLESMGMFTRVLSAINIEEVAEPFIRRRAIRHLEKGRIVIFAAGTGNPFFSTDSAAALRAIEIEADIVLKGTKVDGIYDKDPEIDKTASMFSEIAYIQIVKEGLKVMDNTAVTLCMNHNIPIIIFNLLVKDNLKNIILGKNIGTIVRNV
jgi:uridylate kinase